MEGNLGWWWQRLEWRSSVRQNFSLNENHLPETSCVETFMLEEGDTSFHRGATHSPEQSTAVICGWHIQVLLPNIYTAVYQKHYYEAGRQH